MAERHLNIRGLRRFPVIIIIIVIVIIMVIIYFPNYAKVKKLRDENQRLVDENRQIEAEIIDYQEKIKTLDKDPYVYEKIAREELGVAKENEIVIDVKE